MSTKITSLEELKALREAALAGTQLRLTGENPDAIVLAVGMATCGIASGARDTMQALLREVEQRGLRNVSVVAMDCVGLCYAEPLVEVRMVDQAPVRYGNVDAARAAEIIERHVLKGELVDHAIVGKEVPRS